MKILFMGNNWLGWQILKWLKGTKRDIVGLIIHPRRKQKYTDEILRVAALPSERVFTAMELKQPNALGKIKALKPDVGLSVMYDYILPKEFLNIFPMKCFNLHPGYLPYNKGAFANVWAIVDETPAGVTLHVIDEGIDTGPIVAQQEVTVDPWDTGETLYHKLELAGVALFKKAWPEVEQGRLVLKAQDLSLGRIHKRADTERIDQIDLNKEYKAKDLINILRARTFPPYKGAYFIKNGARIYMELKLLREDVE